jgi:heme-degrading monooxygenase HmoA
LSGDSIASTPDPPYYAVIFTSVRREEDPEGYGLTAEAMMELAAQQPGYLGVESAREVIGITVSYWRDLDSIAGWRRHAEHTVARQNGRAKWYRQFTTRIALVERDYNFTREEA